MAGFTFNGFGASDTYHPLKELKVARCNSCGKEAMFSLMELKMRIRLLYIPTVSVGTKYAVVCTRCKNGYYVDERQKNFILDNPASKVDILPEGVVLRGINADQAAIEEAEEVPEVVLTEEEAAAVLPQDELEEVFVKEEPEQEKKNAVVELAQVAMQVAEQKQSNAAAAEKKTLVPAYRPRKVCPSCRMMFAPEKEVCGICGGPLQEK